MDLSKILGDELYSQVKEKLGDKKIMIDDGNFVPKSRFDEINNQKKELKDQVDNLNKTLQDNSKDFEKFKKAAEGNEELQKQLADYQNKISETQNNFNSTLAEKEKEWASREVNNRKSFTIREKLLMEHADPKYIDLLMNQIDLNSITEAEGKFIGIDDVVTGIKTNFDKLFGKPQIEGTGINSGAVVSNNAHLNALREKARSGRPEDRLAYMNAKQQTENKE